MAENWFVMNVPTCRLAYKTMGKQLKCFFSPLMTEQQDKELMQLACKFFDFRGNSHGDSFFATSIEAKQDPVASLTAFANAVLERWGK